MINKFHQLIKANAKASTPFRSEKSGKEGKIYLYTVIGKSYDWETGETVGVSDVEFMACLDEMAHDGVTDCHLYVNSPGGDVFQAKAMQTAMARFPGIITAHIDALAASAAASLVMYANRIEMTAGSFLMIHKAWAFTVGNEDDHVLRVNTLRELDQSIAQDYVKRTGLPSYEVLQMMKDTTYINAQTALEKGFCDSILEPQTPVQNRWDLSVYGAVPDILRPATIPPPPRVDPELDPPIQNHFDLAMIGRRTALIEMGA